MASGGCRREKTSCLCDCLLEVFSLVGRLGRGDSNGGVVGHKQRRRKTFVRKVFGSRGDMMAAEGSEDEGGGGRSAV